MEALPVVDISSIVEALTTDATLANASVEVRSASESIVEALSKVGAFQCRVDPSLTFSDAFASATADALFSTPEPEKKAAVKFNSGGIVRGFLGIGGESGGAALEVKEAFAVGADSDASLDSANSSTKNKLRAENVFPPSLNHSHRDAIVNIHNNCALVSRAITRGIALALKGNKALEKLVVNDRDASEAAAVSMTRVFRYYPYSTVPSDDAVPNVNRIGSSPHTDWGFLTLIRSEEEGLQIASTPNITPTTVWKTVKPEKDCFIVNGGDYLSVITNGRIVSPLHRVINAEGSVRTSIVFFYYPPYETKVPIDFEFLSSNLDPAVLERLKHLSLFKDQRVGADATKAGGHTVDLKKVSFGDYISSKWESVARSGSSY
ncbi:hypothetical protein HDU99_001234 [Rhizoclosmatium hyalinum]|nr:hypothetical protein HDU99_001234 [Rhizoclosmatium hyalinum]